MSVRTAAFAAVALGAISAAAPAPAAARSFLNPALWEIGPIINGRNYSVGSPVRPSPHPRGFAIDIPTRGHVNYVTFRHGSLAGKSRIILRYRLEAAPGVQIFPRTLPGAPSILSLYFQRGGDTWSSRGPYESYRWYSTFRVHSPIVPGEHVLTAGLNENWTAVQTSSARTNPAGFRQAVVEADRVGFVLGGGEGYGKGVFATGPARLIVTDFRVE
ncbi:MAG TPA: hypothetical protein VNH53_07650 [Sphingomicrobium sp.]|nr:hypothetical protein [Sphingomicrobium sp.]